MAQFITVMNGGKLIQHVTNHRTSHLIKSKNTTYKVTSTHHQMMYPYNLSHEHYDIYGYSTSLSKEYWKNNDVQYDMKGLVEPEIVYYPFSNSMAVQFHPEKMEKNSRAKMYLTNLVKAVLL